MARLPHLEIIDLIRMVKKRKPHLSILQIIDQAFEFAQPSNYQRWSSPSDDKILAALRVYAARKD